jgi:hypothetical protein
MRGGTREGGDCEEFLQKRDGQAPRNKP